MSEIKIGDLVQKKNERVKVGGVLELIYDDQLDEHLAKVAFGTGPETCLIENLEHFRPGYQNKWDDLANCRVGGADSFRTLLTVVRLKTPPSPIISAFGTARTRFYPYQFKPLLKFLENPNQRLLIADDVGLGKTIEAGYVLREWRARQGLQNVLIVVPARLQVKWQQELDRRFDERFDIVASKELKQVFSRVIEGRDLPEFNWIVSYETIRTKPIIALLKEVRPSLDLLIMDEAHRVRNRGTNQYEAADILKDCADAMVFLSATPVQTGMDNLYTLANLLMPDTFESRSMFDEILEANRPIVRACQMVSRGSLLEAADELEILGGQHLTKSLADDPYFQDVISRLREADTNDRSAIVRLQRDVSEFSLLGHVLSRTRKVEVMEKWPARIAQNPHIELSADERAIYDSVKSIIRLLNPQGSGWGATMAAVTAYRYTASCIPAAVDYFRERLAAGGLLPAAKDVAKEEEKEFVESFATKEDDWDTEVNIKGKISDLLGSVLDRCPPPGKDSKFQALLSVLNEIWCFDAKEKKKQRKVVLFAYFKRTLSYLHQQLGNQGIATHVIHGDIDMDDRQDRIEDFLNSNRINVLLSSEVGGEGIDLQKACVVVNYDLPWNPMVVEQRIGRIDRIGQEAEKMIIVNLVAENTIEEEILFRLYQRIGLFKESIGEMDDIIGPMDLQKLMIEALSGKLSAEALRAQIEKTALAAEAKVFGAHSLSQQVDGLLAADQAFLDEINGMVKTRRVPDTKDLKVLLLEMLHAKYGGIRFEESKSSKPSTLTLGRDAITDMGNWARSHSIDAHRLAQRFQQQSAVQVTFDADIAMEHPRVEFIQARHSLIQFAVHILEQNTNYQTNSFALTIKSKKIPKGLWTLGVWGLTLNASRPETRFESVACRLSSQTILSGLAADELLVACLSEASDMDVTVVRPVKAEIEQSISLLQEAFTLRRATIIKEAREVEERKLARVRTTWLQTLTIRRDAAKRRLGLLLQRKAKDFAVKMAQATLTKRELALQKKQEDLSENTKLRWEDHEIAAILLKVE